MLPPFLFFFYNQAQEEGAEDVIERLACVLLDTVIYMICFLVCLEVRKLSFSLSLARLLGFTSGRDKFKRPLRGKLRRSFESLPSAALP